MTTHETSTSFYLARGEWGKRGEPNRIPEQRRVTVSPMRCPMFHDLPDEVRQLVDEGWRITGHVDRSETVEERGKLEPGDRFEAEIAVRTPEQQGAEARAAYGEEAETDA